MKKNNRGRKVCALLISAVLLAGCSADGQVEKDSAGMSESSTWKDNTDQSEDTAKDMIKETGKLESQAETETTEESEQETAGVSAGEIEMYRSYADILQTYQTQVEQTINNGSIDAVSEEINVEFIMGISTAQDKKTAYAGFQLYDLNSDGTPELFIGLNYEDPQADLFVYDVFTYSDGKRIRLMENIGYRAGTCILCEGGVIRDASSGGAAHSMEDYYLLPAQGKELELIESISLHGDENDYNQIRYYHDNEGNPANEISEEEYQAIRDKYVEMKGLKSYQATVNNIQMLQRGELEWVTTSSESTAEKAENNDGPTEGDRYFAGLADLEAEEQELYGSISGDTVSINKALDTVYTWWDEKLNEIYQILKGSLSEEDAKALVQEELEWIDYRDDQAQKAWDEFADEESKQVGTGATAAFLGKSIEITKERVYELAQRVYG